MCCCRQYLNVEIECEKGEGIRNVLAPVNWLGAGFYGGSHVSHVPGHILDWTWRRLHVASKGRQRKWLPHSALLNWKCSRQGIGAEYKQLNKECTGRSYFNPSLQGNKILPTKRRQHIKMKGKCVNIWWYSNFRLRTVWVRKLKHGIITQLTNMNSYAKS